MSRRGKRRPALVHIPAGPNTRSGAVYLEGEFPEFKLRCTVRGCRWRAAEQFYLDAERVGFAHAAEHQWPDERERPPQPPLIRELWRPNLDDNELDPRAIE